MGPKKALDLLLTGRKFGPQEGLAMGFFDQVLSKDDDKSTEERCREWLEERTKFEPEVIAAFKSVVNHAKTHNFLECLEAEKKVFVPLWGGPANVRALAKNIKH